MGRQQFCAKMDEVFGVPAGTTLPGKSLESLGKLDSLGVVGFIALADSDYGVILNPAEIDTCNTVEDLARLIERAASVVVT